MAAKACAACGCPVTDEALKRGAVETAGGRRYCSPCAAKLRSSGAPEEAPAGIVEPGDLEVPDEDFRVSFDDGEDPEVADVPEEEYEVVDLDGEFEESGESEEFEGSEEPEEPEPPARPRPETVGSALGGRGGSSSPVVKPPSPSPSGRRRRRRAGSGRGRPGSRRAAERRKASSAPVRTATARPSAKSRPSVKSRPSPASRPAVATRASSARTRPGTRRAKRRADENGAGEETGTSRRTSRRGTAVNVPWYFHLNRNHWIGIGAGGAILLILMICLAVSASQPRRYQYTQTDHSPLPISGNPVAMMEEARRLFQSGKRQEAIRLLEEAKEVARQQGRDQLVVEINQKLHGIRFKTAP